MEGTEERASPARRRRIITTIAGALAAGGLVLGLSVAALTAAGAQTSTPSPDTTRAPNGRMWPGDGTREHRLLDRAKARGAIRVLGGPGIHGEFTAKKPGGGYRTLATQVGEVTSVSSSSIGVKSEDGFTRTYSVDDKSRVTAGKGGIADVKKGDTVRVLAVVEGGKARSLHILDVSNLEELRGRLKEARPGAQGS